MNEPLRANSYRLVDGEVRVVWQESVNEKMPNSAKMTLNKEDHTYGNLIRMQLLRDHQVKFAGYIHPHPLVHRIDLRVQTLDKRQCTPIQAVDNALADLNQEISIMQEAFRNEVNRIKNTDEY